MNLKGIIEKLNLKVFAGADHLNREVTGGYCSDLLSDVMGNANEGNVWITLQTHKNLMAVAALKELAAIIIVKDLKPDKDVLSTAEKEEIPVLGTTLTAFEIAGRLYQWVQKA